MNVLVIVTLGNERSGLELLSMLSFTAAAAAINMFFFLHLNRYPCIMSFLMNVYSWFNSRGHCIIASVPGQIRV